MNKPLKFFLSALLINSVLVSTAFADSTSQQLQKQQNKLEQDKSSLKTVQNKRDNVETNIENLDNQIQEQMSKITQNKNLVSLKQVDIQNTELQIQKVDIDIAKDQNLYNSRIRAMYINGSDSYIAILLSSKGLSDFISRVDIIKKIAELDKKITKELNDKKNDSKNKKEILSNENIKLLELNSQNDANLTQLKQYITNQKSMIAELKSKELALASDIDSSQVAVNATLKQITEIRKAAPRLIASTGAKTISTGATTISRGVTTISRGATTISDNNVIAYASNFLGTPYVWGGTSPSPGFDCSGFTQYIYAHFGISVGRTTYDQINNGVGVSRNSLQAGDLVFFGTNGPTHMGMYVGNGTYINAPHTGDVIKISSVDRSDYITARRVK